MITSILRKIPLLLVALLFAVSFAIIYFRSKNVTKSEFFKYFKTAKCLDAQILIIAVVVTFVFGIFNHMHSKHYVQAVLSLNYSEASQALNSNGTRYNMSEIVCDEVVERAIELGAFEDVTVKQLKDSLYIYPYVQGDVNDKSAYHISTEFVVEYHATKHTQHLDAENVIALITAAYKEYYIDKYTDNFTAVPEDKKPDFSKMEYMDIVAYFDKEATRILNYLYGMAGKSSSFVTENNTTFNSIAGKVHQFKEKQINENLRSLILQNGYVKNRSDYVDRLSYQNTNTDFDRRKNLVSFDLCNEAIDMYSEEMTRIVLVPTWDQSGKYYMGRTKVGIDELSVKATEFSDNVASNEKEIMDNNLVIDKMQNAPDASNDTSPVNELIASIDKSLQGFLEESIAAGREFSGYRMNQCIAVSMSGTSLFNELKTIAAFAFLIYLALLLYSVAEKFPKKEH